MSVPRPTPDATKRLSATKIRKVLEITESHWRDIRRDARKLAKNRGLQNQKELWLDLDDKIRDDLTNTLPNWDQNRHQDYFSKAKNNWLSEWLFETHFNKSVENSRRPKKGLAVNADSDTDPVPEGFAGGEHANPTDLAAAALNAEPRERMTIGFLTGESDNRKADGQS